MFTDIKGGLIEVSLELNIEGSAESFLRWWNGIEPRQK